MKRFFSFCLIFLILLVGCSPITKPNSASSIDFIAQTDGAFPFYVIGKDDMLYRAQKNGVYPLNVQVCYTILGKQEYLVKYFKQTDTLIFASDLVFLQNKTLCTLNLLQGNNHVEIYQNVLFDSIKISPDASIAFITSDKKLMHYSKGNLSHIDDNVLKYEFASNDKIVYSLDNGYFNKTGILYPTYCATDDYRFFVGDTFDIIKSPSNNNLVFLVKNSHVVQKRAALVEVADCIILLDGQELAQIPSVVLSQFSDDNPLNFLLSCDEMQSTLKFLLYKIDAQAPVLLAKNVLAGKNVSFDGSAYAFEAESDDKISAFVAKSSVFPIEKNVTLDNVFCFGKSVYTLDSGELFFNATVILKNVKEVCFDKKGLVCFVQNGESYFAYLVNDTTAQLLAKNVLTTDFVLEDEYFYYFSGDTVSKDLFVADKNGSMALLPNADATYAFAHFSGDIAAVRKDDSILYYSIAGLTQSTLLPVKALIK